MYNLASLAGGHAMGTIHMYPLLWPLPHTSALISSQALLDGDRS